MILLPIVPIRAGLASAPIYTYDRQTRPRRGIHHQYMARPGPERSAPISLPWGRERSGASTGREAWPWRGRSSAPWPCALPRFRAASSPGCCRCSSQSQVRPDRARSLARCSCTCSCMALLASAVVDDDASLVFRILEILAARPLWLTGHAWKNKINSLSVSLILPVSSSPFLVSYRPVSFCILN